ncbi:DUF4431 domain-containing protein [Salmonella enterica subsp. enterica serovar Ituri]|nr:DUF4431 domain-containing protein [Salmonella enterica subsp. enterica serovar Ituri]
MRRCLFLLAMCCASVFAGDMVWIKPDAEELSRTIVDVLLRETGLSREQFDIRRLATGWDDAWLQSSQDRQEVAYFCGVVNVGAAGYRVYERVLLPAGSDGWISAASFDHDAATQQTATCHYDVKKSLSTQSLLAAVEATGRKNLCLPVRENDPLRRPIMDTLRASYVGDGHLRTLNGALPDVKFVVERLCATDDYAWFYGQVTGEAKNPYWHRESHMERVLATAQTISPDMPHRQEKRYLEAVLKKAAEGVWRLVPEHYFLTQQTTQVDWFDDRPIDGFRFSSRRADALSAVTLANIAQRRGQRCAREGDTISVVGTLHEDDAGEWTITPDKPLSCVRDADQHQPDWNAQMQLVLTAQERNMLKALLGKKVRVGGDIFLALSDSHHTPLLLDNIFRLTEIK